MNRILMIGATGTVGRQVFSQLQATGAQVRALARMQPAAAQTQQLSLWKNSAVNSTGTEPTRSANLIKRVDATVLAVAFQRSCVCNRLTTSKANKIGSAPLYTS